MLWLAVGIAIAVAVGLVVWCGLATVEVMYGYPLHRHLARRAAGRRAERRFLATDVRELDEAFSRVVRSTID